MNAVPRSLASVVVLLVSAAAAPIAFAQTWSPTRNVEMFVGSGPGGGADVTIDALWGEPALAAMRATARGARHVQLGQSAAATLEIPAPVLRAPGLSLLGFAYFQAPPDVQRDAYRRLAQAAADGAIELEVERVPLAEVGSAWERQRRGAGRKLVVVP